MEKGRLIIDGVDVSGSVGSAASVPYSNTNSGLEATNTQGAIDELATSVSKLNSNLESNNFEWKLVGSANGSNVVSLKNLEYNEIQLFVTNTKSTDGWYDSSIVISKPVLLKQKIIFLPSYYASSTDCNYICCKYDAQNESVYISHNMTGKIENSTLEVYYR